MEALKLEQDEVDILYNLLTHEIEYEEDCKENEPTSYDRYYHKQLKKLLRKVKLLG